MSSSDNRKDPGDANVRVFGGIFLVVAIGILLYFIWPGSNPAYTQQVADTSKALLGFQQSCLEYVAPPDQVVYALPVPTTVPASVPNFLRELGIVPPCWASFDAATGASHSYHNTIPPEPQSSPVVFLHERRTPAGRSLLVCVICTSSFIINGNAANLPRTLPYVAFVLSPGDASHPPALIPQPTLGRDTSSQFLLPHPARIFAGQPDPKNLSHFTIRYESKAGAADVIDGYVNNGGEVTLTVGNSRPAANLILSLNTAAHFIDFVISMHGISTPFITCTLADPRLNPCDS